MGLGKRDKLFGFVGFEGFLLLDVDKVSVKQKFPKFQAFQVRKRRSEIGGI